MEDIKSFGMSKELLIKKIRAICYTESSKPYGEMDADLVEECVGLLMELEGRERLSHDEIIRRVKAIPFKDEKRKPYRRLKTLLIAACIAVMLLIAGSVVMARGTDIMAALKQWSHYIIEMVEGENVDVGGITIQKPGIIARYSTIEELLENENLNILYPSVLPDGAEITGVGIIDGNYGTEICFKTTDSELSIEAFVGPEHFADLSAGNTDIETINQFECYFFPVGGHSYQCTFLYEDYSYVINDIYREDIVLIIQNMKGR